jgi:hypothetical protein
MPGTEVSSGDENIGGSVTISSGTVNVGNRRDIFAEILCDTVGTFLRRFQEDDAGVVTIVNTTLDGTTVYVPVGAVARCDGNVTVDNQFDDEYQVLCDTVTSFVRRYRTDLAGAITVTNLTLAGGAYVPVGAVGSCSDTVNNFPSGREFVILCDNAGPFLRRFNTTSAGVVTATDTLLDGTTAYVSVGTVSACPRYANNTVTFSTINLAAGAVVVGAGSKGWTATLQVASGVTPAAGDTGVIGGQTVAVGYSVGISADDGRTIPVGTTLTAAGVAFWTVGVMT